jgi:hypothetical protein
VRKHEERQAKEKADRDALAKEKEQLAKERAEFERQKAALATPPTQAPEFTEGNAYETAMAAPPEPAEAHHEPRTQRKELTGTRLYEYQVGALIGKITRVDHHLQELDRLVSQKLQHAQAWGHGDKAADYAELDNHLTPARSELTRLHGALLDAIEHQGGAE